MNISVFATILTQVLPIVGSESVGYLHCKENQILCFDMSCLQARVKCGFSEEVDIEVVLL